MSKLHNAVYQNVQVSASKERNQTRDVASNPIRKQNVNGKDGMTNPVTFDSSERSTLRDITNRSESTRNVNQRNTVQDPVSTYSTDFYTAWAVIQKAFAQLLGKFCYKSWFVDV